MDSSAPSQYLYQGMSVSFHAEIGPDTGDFVPLHSIRTRSSPRRSKAGDGLGLRSLRSLSDVRLKTRAVFFFVEHVESKTDTPVLQCFVARDSAPPVPGGQARRRHLSESKGFDRVRAPYAGRTGVSSDWRHRSNWGELPGSPQEQAWRL